MRTVLTKEFSADLATKITIELVQFAKSGYEVKGTYEYPHDKDKNHSFTVTPNPYHAKIVYNREIDVFKANGYVIETEEL